MCVKSTEIGSFGAKGIIYILQVETKRQYKNIKKQLQDDVAGNQISIKEYIDPFTGETVK